MPKVLFFVLLSVFACAEGPGEASYKGTCVMCHGEDGKGKTKMGLSLNAADLTSADVHAVSDAYIAQTIRKGKGKMPPFEASLTPEEITNIVQYVRSLHK